MSILLTHNARCTMIQSPAVVADPNKGIAGSGPTVRWTGVVEAYIDEDIADVVKQGQRVQISQTIVDLPANMPVWPNQEDLITITRISGLVQYAPAGPLTETLTVRKTDGGLLYSAAKLRVFVVRN